MINNNVFGLEEFMNLYQYIMTTIHDLAKPINILNEPSLVKEWTEEFDTWKSGYETIVQSGLPYADILPMLFRFVCGHLSIIEAAKTQFFKTLKMRINRIKKQADEGKLL